MFGIYKLRRRVTELENDRDFLLRQARVQNTGYEKELNWLRDRITALELSRPILIAADDYARLLKRADKAAIREPPFDPSINSGPQGNVRQDFLFPNQAQNASPPFNKIENRN